MNLNLVNFSHFTHQYFYHLSITGLFSCIIELYDELLRFYKESHLKTDRCFLKNCKKKFYYISMEFD